MSSRTGTYNDMIVVLDLRHTAGSIMIAASIETTTRLYKWLENLISTRCGRDERHFPTYDVVDVIEASIICSLSHGHVTTESSKRHL